MDKKFNNYLFIAGFFALLILIYVAGRRKKKDEKLSFETDVDTASVRPDFNAATMASEIRDVIKGWFVTKSAAKATFEKANALSTGEVQLVYNYYNQNFAADGKTLLSELRAEWFKPEAAERFILKMEAINLA